MSHDVKAIAIDFGTSTCSVGIVQDGKLIIFKDDRGSCTTPSYVSFTNCGDIIGQEAKDRVTANPKSTVYAMKRLIGKQNKKECLAKIGLSLQTSSDSHGNLLCVIEGKERPIDLIRVTADMLGYMKNIAENNIGKEIQEAVISVPTIFDSNQRQATITAGERAGFSKVILINEPTATAVAFEGTRTVRSDENILVADFGCGFVSLTVAHVKVNTVEILASEGHDFGGFDFKQQMAEMLVKDKRTELFHALEKIMQDFKLTDTNVQSCSAMNETHVKINVSKRSVLKLLEEISISFRKYLSTFFSKPDFKTHDISTVVLVGKTWEMPSLKNCLLSFWPEDKKPRVHATTFSVLHGASIIASTLGNNEYLRVVDKK